MSTDADPPPAAAVPPAPAGRWQRTGDALVRAYHRYGHWLVGISWKRFVGLSLLLLIVVALVHDLPPFTWKLTERIEEPRDIRPPPRWKAPRPPRLPELAGADGPARAASAAASAAEQARQAAGAAAAVASAVRGFERRLPPGETSAAVRRAIAEAREEFEAAIRDAEREAVEAAREATQAARDAALGGAGDAASERLPEPPRPPRQRVRVTRVGIGDMMVESTLLWIFASAILKLTYKARVQAETQARRASAAADAESLKRQVVEARMAAMQAQIEPHFLFNTLASIDHLIETDPPRASAMQKNLIALLRASMPTMREAAGHGGGSGLRDLGREIAVIRPYLEILKVRMEERLTTEVAVPEGLLSAEFPPMMIQTLVENAIQHGLEPQPDGGHLRVAADIVHGRLRITVADTGVGFGAAATAGTGVGLANVRERLQLLYGTRASLTITANQPTGTQATITVPYRTVEIGTA